MAKEDGRAKDDGDEKTGKKDETGKSAKGGKGGDKSPKASPTRSKGNSQAAPAQDLTQKKKP